MNAVIQKRLGLIREEMKKEGIAYYMIPTSDFHNSEYVDDYFKAREYFSGFTGSNGTLIVGQEMAGLWPQVRLLSYGRVVPTCPSKPWTPNPCHNLFLSLSLSPVSPPASGPLCSLLSVRQNQASVRLPFPHTENDVECNPVALSYGFLTQEEMYFFIQEQEVTEEFAKYAEENHIRVKRYEDITAFLEEYTYNGKVLLDEGNSNYALFKIITERAGYVSGDNPTELLKAIKNETFRIPAQIIQIFCCIHFRYFLLSDILFQPIDKFRHGSRVKVLTTNAEPATVSVTC